MSNKAPMRRSALELTQKIQRHFPRLPEDSEKAWNDCEAEDFEINLAEVFGRKPKV